MTFTELNISNELVEALNELKITEPTEIQKKSIKTILEGRDLIACSKTGSGKTLAYLLPIISKIDYSCKNIQALILVPTQELAAQINQNIEELASKSNLDIKSIMLIGEGNINRQIENLKQKPAIVVGTSARISQLIRMKKLHIHNVKTFVLDEADKMLDKSNLENVLFIRKSLMKYTQVLLFSASISYKKIKAANNFTFKPVIYDLSKENKEEMIPRNIKHIFIITDRRERIETLRKIAKALKNDKTMIFINTKYDLNESLQKLEYHNYNVAALSSERDKMEKKRAITDLKDGKINYLLATDIAARGLQIDNVETVINVNLPEETTEYLHRAGRCGRNGNSGLCVSIITENEISKIAKLQKEFNINIVQKKLYNGKIVSK